MRRRLQILIFIFPALAFLALFWLGPIAATVGISLTDWDYMTPDFRMVGLENYRNLLGDEAFAAALRHTLMFALETVIPGVALGLALAALVTAAGRNNHYAAFLFAPWVTPTVAVSIVWTWIFEPDRGFANQVLRWLGGSGSAWLKSSDTALAAVALVTVWKNMGYVMLLFMGALSRVPGELGEAAAVDGAGTFRRFRSVTLPLIAPSVRMVGLLLAVEALRAYDQIQILTQGGPSGSTRTLLYLYYQLGFEQFRMGQAAAAVVVLMALGLGLAWLQGKMRTGNREEEEWQGGER